MRNLTPSKGLVALLVLVICAGLTYAGDFAPEGTRGTLEINITVTGKGSLASGKVDFDSTQWEVLNSLTYSAPVTAQTPIIDMEGDNAARAAGVEKMTGSGLTDEEQAFQDEWDKKLEDCGGDEDCEDAVMAAMMADPRYQKLMAKMQGIGSDVMQAAGQINLDPRFQLWLPPSRMEKSVNGNCKVEREEAVFGIVEPAGGRSNFHHRFDGAVLLGQGADVMSFYPTVTLDKQTSTYKLYVDANFNVQAKESEEIDGAWKKTKSLKNVPFLGEVPASGDWKSALTFTGQVSSLSSPSFSAKKTIKADFGNPKDPHYTFPVTITIEWKFKTGA